MYMYWKVWTEHMTDKIWFLRKKGSEATDRSVNCSYWPVGSPVFILNLRDEFAQSIANERASKRTFSKSQIRHRTTFRLLI